MQENIRNFSIIAHIDHGKSTLADRLLELTRTVEPQKMVPQFLDSMELEREKGITIKLKTIRMRYRFEEKEYILNLVDTPGHVDFSYEVSRSLAAVEGAILLVDATQGIQAQTLANWELAKKQNLVIIPVVNKIDSPLARIKESVEELANLLNVSQEEIIRISARDGTNVEKVLEAIIKKIPPPSSILEKRELRALIFDSQYDLFKGVIALVRIMEGEIIQGEEIETLGTKAKGKAKEVGYLTPSPSPQNKLRAGEIGYIATGIKEPGKIHVGDTITKEKAKVEPLSGYQQPVPVVFASLYPENPAEFELLKNALNKLKLNDPALFIEQEKREVLGRGFRCGFLGTLHVEIVSERLQREFGIKLVISNPSVVYKIIDQKDKERLIYSASDWPDVAQIKRVQELWAELQVITPSFYAPKLIELLKNCKGVYKETRYLSPERAFIFFEIPLRIIVSNLYDKIKTVSQGYASMNYQILEFRDSRLVKLEILINGKKEEPLSKIVPEEEAYDEGKKIVEKLRDLLPPEQFRVILQAAVRGRVIARETIKARRKDVTGYLYGGDVTRKMKLLEKQKKGKKILEEKGKVNIPLAVFIRIFKS